MSSPGRTPTKEEKSKRGKKNLRASCPKDKLEFKCVFFFSSPEENLGTVFCTAMDV